MNPSIRPWMSAVANSLERGYVLTIDYGYEAAELYSDDRSRGTLQSYYRHTDGHSPYQRVGRQDMTAHVDFTALIEEGRAAGLRPVFLTTQAEFLHSLGFTTRWRCQFRSPIGIVKRKKRVRQLCETSSTRTDLGGSKCSSKRRMQASAVRRICCPKPKISTTCVHRHCPRVTCRGSTPRRHSS